MKSLAEQCEETLKGSSYDKFWVESMQKKLNTIEKVETLLASLEKIKSVKKGDKVEMFKTDVENLLDVEKAKQEKESIRKAEEEEKKKAEVVDSNWTVEEVKLLTKAIIKFPPGTKQRWFVITDYIGNKTQKEVLKKAQELKNKRENEIE